MITTWYQFDAADVLFFRDGRPFNQGDPAQMAIKSLFPPHPTTAVGALRAALARGLGWTGTGGWDRSVTDKLGDGDDLQGLQFRGPYLCHGLAGVLFPAPAVLVRETTGERRLRRLAPGRPRQCDLGSDVRLAVPPRDVSRSVKATAGAWITAPGMQHVLNGGVPSRREIYLTGEDENDVEELLFAREVRIGLARNAATRTAEPGALYTAGFVRPAAEEGVGLVVGVKGLDPALESTNPIPFGGEGRFAWLDANDTHAVALPAMSKSFETRNGKFLYTVTLITPAHLPGDWSGPGQSLDKLPGIIVSACHERPLMVGGWASQHFKKDGWGPQPLKPMLPPGSTWFMEAEPGDEGVVRDRHEKHIGERSDWGYGQILIGTWKDEQRDEGRG